MTNAERQKYRAPCQGWTSLLRPTLGGCWNNWNNSEATISRFQNTTLTTDYANPPGDDISLYSRPSDPAFYPDCASEPTCGDGLNGFPYCDIPNTGSPDISGTGSLRLTQGRYFQWLTHSGSASVADCAKLGFKNIQARKHWFGKEAYRSRSHGVWDAMILRLGYDQRCDCGHHNEDTAAIDTKYRTITANATARHWFDDGDGYSFDYEAACSNTVTVDRYSGRVTTNCVSSSDEPSPTEGVLAAAQTAMAFADGNIQTIFGEFCIDTFGGLGDPTTVTVLGDNHFLCTWMVNTDLCDDPDCLSSTNYDTASYIVEFDADSMINYQHFGTKDGMTWIKLLDWTLTYNDTSFSYVYDYVDPTPDATGGWEIDANGSLSDAYTATMLKADIDTLLSQWSLTNDTIYPWRTDLNINGVNAHPTAKIWCLTILPA